MHKRRWLALFVSTALVFALAAPFAVATAASKSTAGNALNVLVVRFAKGTTKQQMVSAVSAAGGEVVSDLSKLGRVAVSPTAADFQTKIKKNSSVQAVWADKVYSHGVVDPASAGNGVPGTPELGNPGPDPIPDPWHNASSFLGETNPRGILQWDDLANGATAAWATSTGDPAVRVAVIDTGVSPSHKELKANLVHRRQHDPVQPHDSPVRPRPRAARLRLGGHRGPRHLGRQPDRGQPERLRLERHRTAGQDPRLQGAVDHARRWPDQLDRGRRWCGPAITAPTSSTCRSAATTRWRTARTSPCGPMPSSTAQHTAIFASAGNEHVRVNEVNLVIGGHAVHRHRPGRRGCRWHRLDPAGRPGLQRRPAGPDRDPGRHPRRDHGLRHATTPTAPGAAAAGVPAGQYWTGAAIGAQDQLTYYSSYGSRVDIGAPGGARKFNIPRSSGGPADILYGGWGELGALTSSGEICSDPGLASLLTFACFKANGACVRLAPGHLDVVAERGRRRGARRCRPSPACAATRRRSWPASRPRLARTWSTSWDPTIRPTSGCRLRVCHVRRGFCYPKFSSPISFSDAYGAGMVNAGAAVGP